MAARHARRAREENPGYPPHFEKFVEIPASIRDMIQDVGDDI
jgi:hypothetical protein